jgi:hypothetical protein
MSKNNKTKETNKNSKKENTKSFINLDISSIA